MAEREYTEVEKTVRDLLEPDSEEAALLGTIKRVNKLSESGDMPTEEVIELLSAFNEKWPYSQRIFQGYGRAYALEDGESKLFDGSEEPIISFGFAVNDGEDFAEVGHHIGVVNTENNTIETLLWARLDDFYIDTTMFLDGTRATHLLGHFYPDIVNEIEDKFFKAQSDIDFVLSLRDFSINHDERGHSPDEASPDEVRNMLTTMLEHKVPLKTAVPWSVAFSGIYFPLRPDLSINHEDAKVEYAWQKWLAIPRGIVMLPEVKIDEAEGYYRSNSQVSKPAISLFIFPATADQEPQGEIVVVPITENLKIVSNLEKVEMFEDLEDS